MKNKIYQKFKTEVESNSDFVQKVNENVYLAKGDLFFEILEVLPPHLKKEEAKVPLDSIYDVGFHVSSKSIFICNKGAYLLAKAPITGKKYACAHIGFSIFFPNHGIEIADVGIIGDLAKSKFVVMRPESACAPSFIVGSQRCNCYDQWMLIRELAAHSNHLEIPHGLNADELEEYMASYFKTNEDRIPVPKENGQGFILIHMASQNGMGSGANEGSFTDDLTAVAYIRHRGEYTAEQVHHASLAGGFTALGLVPDPRKLNDHAAYKVPAVILDYFNLAKKPIIALTNNSEKVHALTDLDFLIHRIQFVGRADTACGVETADRREEFLHQIPENFSTTIEEDLHRVSEKIKKEFNNKFEKSQNG